uniref:(northern house mosquito) hypothetical protein n=1 Tax=Culex pipiens TaxID=7175 RepID=A0A8D8D554_CULPI
MFTSLTGKRKTPGPFPDQLILPTRILLPSEHGCLAPSSFHELFHSSRRSRTKKRDASSQNCRARSRSRVFKTRSVGGAQLQSVAVNARVNLGISFLGSRRSSSCACAFCFSTKSHLIINSFNRGYPSGTSLPIQHHGRHDRR